MAIKYTKGDATHPQGTGNKIIAHICNDIGGWGRGFVVAVSKRWKEPEREYRLWALDLARTKSLPLGEIQLVSVEPDTWVCNMVAQRGVVPLGGVSPIRYEALDECLRLLAAEAAEHSASIHMPRIGCGLAGGTWDKVEPLVEQRLSGIDVTVYDLP